MSPSWTFLIPFKDSRVAKSRLGLPDALRREVAVAMVHETVERLLAVPQVARVVVVCSRPEDLSGLESRPRVELRADRGVRGLNGAIRLGEAAARAVDPGAAIGVCPADLPRLDPAELAAVLDLCAAYPRCVVPDHHGSGTTMLTAAADVPLAPAFGPDSFAAHTASGARSIELPEDSSLRHDVDEPADLQRVRRLAPDSCTARILARAEPSGEVVREHTS